MGKNGVIRSAMSRRCLVGGMFRHMYLVMWKFRQESTLFLGSLRYRLIRSKPCSRNIIHRLVVVEPLVLRLGSNMVLILRTRWPFLFRSQPPAQIPDGLGLSLAAVQH